MSSHSAAHRPATPDPRRLPVSVIVAAAILLALPLAALLAVPVYSRHDPVLWGFPFFYWWQFLWMFVGSGTTYLAYVLIRRARGAGGPR